MLSHTLVFLIVSLERSVRGIILTRMILRLLNSFIGRSSIT
jgi:hypothetical protein